MFGSRDGKGGTGHTALGRHRGPVENLNYDSIHVYMNLRHSLSEHCVIVISLVFFLYKIIYKFTKISKFVTSINVRLLLDMQYVSIPQKHSTQQVK